MSRSCASLLLLFAVFAPLAFPQQSPTNAQRDQQALAILNQCLNAAGGVQAISGIRDFSATGDITYYWDPEVTANVAIKGRGLAQIRIDATLPEGVRTVIANNGSGSITEPDGTLKVLPHEGAVRMGSETFPYALLLRAIQDTSVSATYVGLVNHLGNQVHDVRIQRNYPSSVDPTGAESKLSSRDFYIDPNSFLVLSVSNLVASTVDGVGIHHEIAFANYQAISGITTPLSITESIHGQSLFTMKLTQVAFNTNLTDDNFKL